MPSGVHDAAKILFTASPVWTLMRKHIRADSLRCRSCANFLLKVLNGLVQDLVTAGTDTGDGGLDLDIRHESNGVPRPSVWISVCAIGEIDGDASRHVENIGATTNARSMTPDERCA